MEKTMTQSSVPVPVPVTFPNSQPSQKNVQKNTTNEQIAFSLKHKTSSIINLYLFEKGSKEDLREYLKEHQKEEMRNGITSNFSSCASFASYTSSGRSSPLQFQLELDHTEA